MDNGSQLDLPVFAGVARQRIADAAIRDAELTAHLRFAVAENARLQDENNRLRSLLNLLQMAVKDAGINVEDSNASANI